MLSGLASFTQHSLCEIQSWCCVYKWVVYTLGILWIKWPWIFLYKYLCGSVLSFLLEVPGRRVSKSLGKYILMCLPACLNLRGCQRFSQSGSNIFRSPHTPRGSWWLRSVADLFLVSPIPGLFRASPRGPNLYFPNDNECIFRCFDCGSNLYFPNDIKCFFMW